MDPRYAVVRDGERDCSNVAHRIRVCARDGFRVRSRRTVGESPDSGMAVPAARQWRPARLTVVAGPRLFAEKLPGK